MEGEAVKPNKPVARRKDYQFDEGSHGEAVELIRAYHYAKGAANTSTARTIMRREQRAVGAALWMPPTAGAAKALAKRHLGSENLHKKVLALSRLVVVPGEPQNAAGILLGRTTKDVARDERWALLVTYADEAQGHEGTIYRATGWTFDGFTEPQIAWHLDGKQVSRLSTKSRTYEEMRAIGATQSKSRKRRFYKIVGTVRDE